MAQLIMMFLMILAFALFGVSLGLTIYGLILAFKASLLLFALVLILEPSPFVFGLIGVFGHPELCQMIVKWLNLPL